MLNRMSISMPQRNSGNGLLSENTYIKPKMPTMRMRTFPMTENNNLVGSLSDRENSSTNVRWNNNPIKNTESGLIRNFDTAPGITGISMREILGVPKKNCSSCRGG